MASRYPYQVLSRLASAKEKAAIEKLARDNCISVSAAIRFVALQAAREGWRLGLQKKDPPNA